MKPSLLNSIYVKLSKQEFSTKLEQDVNEFINKVYVLFLETLEDQGITNLEQRIKIDRYDQPTVGNFILETILYGDPFKKQMEKFENEFLQNCDCEYKEEILGFLKSVLNEEGCESTDILEWNNMSKGFADCEDFSDLREKFEEWELE